jgi:hypothetical protein
VIQQYNGISLSNSKKWTTEISNNVGGSQNNNTGWSKSGKDTYCANSTILNFRAGGVAQMVECLPSKCEDLSWNRSSAKKKKIRKTKFYKVEVINRTYGCGYLGLGAVEEGKDITKLKVELGEYVRHFNCSDHCLGEYLCQFVK